MKKTLYIPLTILTLTTIVALLFFYFRLRDDGTAIIVLVVLCAFITLYIPYECMKLIVEKYSQESQSKWSTRFFWSYLMFGVTPFLVLLHHLRNGLKPLSEMNNISIFVALCSIIFVCITFIIRVIFARK